MTVDGTRADMPNEMPGDMFFGLDFWVAGLAGSLFTAAPVAGSACGIVRSGGELTASSNSSTSVFVQRPIVSVAEIAPARGVSTGGRIILLPDMTAAETLSVMTHALAHELLHGQASRRDSSGTRIRELEAEAGAHVVCRGVGLNCGTASADYILHYDGDRAAPSRSLERIERTASEILTAISDI